MTTMLMIHPARTDFLVIVFSDFMFVLFVRQLLNIVSLDKLTRQSYRH